MPCRPCSIHHLHRSRRNSGPKSGHVVQIAVVLFCIFHQYMTKHPEFDQSREGEGCRRQPWSPAGAPFDASVIYQLGGAKIHGTPPTIGPGHRNASQRDRYSCIQKRSFRRACHRAMRDGLAWHKGQPLTSEEVPSYYRTVSPPARQKIPPTPMPQKGSNTKYLNAVHLNVGGLSSHRLEELQLWGQCVEADIIVLTETRWCFCSEWQSPKWHFIHSGTQSDKADGILILIRRQFCAADQIGLAECIPGRLLHLRIHFQAKAMDIVAGYQFVDNKTTLCMTHRKQWWQKLSQCLGQLPSRNSFVMLGDLNCSLRYDPPHVGSSHFVHQGQQQAGPQHRDMDTFHQILKTHKLVALNSWNPKIGPSFVNGNFGSRIDFCLGRIADSDGESKNVRMLQSAEIMALSGARHIPMFCRIRLFRFTYRVFTGPLGITYRQRLRCRLDWSLSESRWLQMHREVQDVVLMQQEQDCTSEDTIDLFHRGLLQVFHSHYGGRQTHPQTSNSTTIVQRKWYHRRELHRIKFFTQRSCFMAWFHSVRYTVTSRNHRQIAKNTKRQKFYDLLLAVQKASVSHDNFKVYNLINQYTPRQAKRKIRLRSSNGLAAPHHKNPWKS